MRYFAIIDMIKNEVIYCDNEIELGYKLERIMDTHLYFQEINVKSYNYNRVYVIEGKGE